MARSTHSKGLVIVLCLVLAEASFAQTAPAPRGITATGTCLKKITQDRASVSFTTNVLASTATQSSSDATKESQKLRAALTSLKLENAVLESSGFSVFEDRHYEKQKLVSRGFRTRIEITLEASEISRIGEAIAAASKLGVKEINNLRTFVSAEKHKNEYESCLEIATHNGRDKALKLAKGAGVKLGNVIRIDEGSPASIQHFASPRMIGASYNKEVSFAPDADAGPTIEAKPEDLNVTATITFEAD
jgi:uncharacterized protein YggE